MTNDVTAIKELTGNLFCECDERPIAVDKSVG